MTTDAAKPLTNAYAQEYYDAQVGALKESYTDNRWHSSPVRSFEYAQTQRALRKALSGRTYAKTLEIGPGDGVWTQLIKESVSGSMHLVEQSAEMLSGAKKRLESVPGITFEHADFMASKPEGNNDLIIAVRCFEYFQDKEGALRKMKDLLAPGGKLVIVTKNSKLYTGSPVQYQTLHSDQLAPEDMQRLAVSAGLTVVHAYPAILRWKANYAPMRTLFDTLHKLAVATKGALILPFLTTYATESYVYELKG